MVTFTRDATGIKIILGAKVVFIDGLQGWLGLGPCSTRICFKGNYSDVGNAKHIR